MSKYAIIDYRAYNLLKSVLEKHFDMVIPSLKMSVGPSVCGHPDIGVCKVDNSTIVVSPNSYKYYKSVLPGIDVKPGKTDLSEKYPFDVCYNVACGNSVAIHNFNFTDEITLSVIDQKFLKHINVRQGYSKCSVCFINDNGIITDDDSIYKKLLNEGFDVLKIEKGKIILNEMNYGFFGGATGYFNGKLYLNGEIKFLNDSKIIIDYLIKHNTELIELKQGIIEDIGTIICLEEK